MVKASSMVRESKGLMIFLIQYPMDNPSSLRVSKGQKIDTNTHTKKKKNNKRKGKKKKKKKKNKKRKKKRMRCSYVSIAELQREQKRFLGY
jgi:predicted O-linked N-acetylglucosamine transferase (SPINDLY family)